MSGVFISYRRSDTSAEAELIYSFLKPLLGHSSIFRDIATIQPGSDFRNSLDFYMARAQVQLVLIGPNWLNASDNDGRRRLCDSADYVRQEIGTALSRRIVLIPVLCNGAQMPPPNDLPTELHELSYLHASTLRPRHEEEDLAALHAIVRLHTSAAVIDRLTFAIACGVSLVVVTVGLTAGVLGSLLVLAGIQTVFPAISGVTRNYPSGGFGLRFDPVHPAAEVAGILGTALLVLVFVLFAVAWTVQRRYKNSWWLLLTAAALGLLVGLNFTDFIFNDSLTNIYAQLGLDIISACVGTYMIFALFDVPAKGLIMRLSKALLIGLIFLSCVAVPGLFAILFVCWKVGVIEDPHLFVSDLFTLASGLISVTLAVLSYLRQAQRPDAERS